LCVIHAWPTLHQTGKQVKLLLDEPACVWLVCYSHKPLYSYCVIHTSPLYSYCVIHTSPWYSYCVIHTSPCIRTALFTQAPVSVLRCSSGSGLVPYVCDHSKLVCMHFKLRTLLCVVCVCVSVCVSNGVFCVEGMRECFPG